MSNLIKIIHERLTQAFSPVHLEVVDDSEQHKGHAGSQGGAGHFTVIMQADSLNNQSRVAAHRAIYQVLDDFIPEKIHALKIKLINLVK